MGLFMKAFTAIALNQAVGFNAVLPVLLVAIIGRYESFFTTRGLPAPVSLPDNLMFITSTGCIAFLILITVIESIADKAQWFDNVKHVTIDPIVSSLSSAGVTFTIMSKSLGGSGGMSIMTGLPSCMAMTGGTGGDVIFWAEMICFILLGLFITISFLFIKTALRWVISAIPDMGVSNILVSLLEDGIVIVSVVLAFFAPLLAVIFTLLLAFLAVYVIYCLKKKADERERAEIRNLSFIKAVI